jgi:hypothetical protein
MMLSSEVDIFQSYHALMEKLSPWQGMEEADKLWHHQKVALEHY